MLGVVVTDHGQIACMVPVEARTTPLQAGGGCEATTQNKACAEQVLFSTIAALLGSPGQASYAAASGNMNALASRWRHGGNPAMSIQWGPWANIGMAAGSAELAIRAHRSGLGMLTSEQGLAALGGALSAQLSAAAPCGLTAAPISWQRFLQQRARHSHGDDADMFAEFAEENSSISETAPGKPVISMPVNITDGEEDLQRTLGRMKVLVRAAVSSVLGSEVSDAHPLMAAGACRAPPQSPFTKCMCHSQSWLNADVVGPCLLAVNGVSSSQQGRLLRLIRRCNHYTGTMQVQAAQHAGPHPRLIRRCCRSGLAHLGGAAQCTGGGDGRQPASHTRL